MNKEVTSTLEQFSKIIEELPNIQINDYISYFVNEYDLNKSKYLKHEHIQNTSCFENRDICKDEPFLSVVVRTQGNRIDALKQNFDSLYNQVNQNFEIILVCHKATEDNKISLNKLLAELPPDFRNKISLYYLNSGNRTAPLNYGFSASKGKYIAVLDDDDIALENWVEEFYKASLNHSGKILHAFVEEQNWYYDNNLLVKRKLDQQEYCEKFSISMQIELNRCPINGLAFPSYAFKSLFIIFDETLTTNEDWDYLMRTAFVTGVYDIETVTAVYIRRNNLPNAYSEHSENEWNKNIYKLKNKFVNMPILYPAGESKSCVKFEWRPINFYSLFKIYKKTILLNLLCHCTFFMFKKLNKKLAVNKEFLKRIKNNDKETIFKL